MINHIHTKPQGALGNALADAAHANNAKRGVVDIHPQGVGNNRPLIPIAVPNPALGLGHATRSRHQQGKAKVCGCIREHIRGIRCHYPGSRHRRHIKIVIPHRNIGNNLEAFGLRQGFGINSLTARYQCSRNPSQLGCKYFWRHNDICLIGDNIKGLL